MTGEPRDATVVVVVVVAAVVKARARVRRGSRRQASNRG
jgi:hypothetical protein